MSQLKTLCIFGTRPEAIKMALFVANLYFSPTVTSRKKLLNEGLADSAHPVDSLYQQTERSTVCYETQTYLDQYQC